MVSINNGNDDCNVINTNLHSEPDFIALKEDRDYLYNQIEGFKNTTDKLSSELAFLHAKLRESATTVEPNNKLLEFDASDVSMSTTAVLESMTSYKKSMKHAIISNNVETMKNELVRQVAPKEIMLYIYKILFEL